MKSHHKPVSHIRENHKPRNPNNRLIYTDWWGPLATSGYHGEHYIQAFLDDASGLVCCFASKSKDCGAANLRAFAVILAELTDGECKIACIQSDYENLFTQGDFAAECTRMGIHQRFSSAYSHNQNGRVERYFRTMEVGVTAMLDHSGAPAYLWPYALQTFVSHFNRMSNTNGDITPIEQITGFRPDISYFRVWGCPAQVHLEKHDHAKFTSKCINVLNLGPAPKTKDAYYVYIPSSRTIRVSSYCV